MIRIASRATRRIASTALPGLLALSILAGADVKLRAAQNEQDAKLNHPAPSHALPSLAPADMNIVGELDARRFFDEPALASVRERLIAPEMQTTFDNLRAWTGLDLRRDVDRLVFAGPGGPSRVGEGDGLILLQGRFKQNDIVSAVMSTDQYDMTMVGNHQVHSFYSARDGQMRSFTFLGADTMAIGSAAAIGRVIGVYDGTESGSTLAADLGDAPGASSAAATSSAPPLLRVCFRPPAGALDNPALDAGFPFVAGLRGARLDLDDRNGIQVQLSVHCADARDGALATRVLDGVAALMQLQRRAPGLATLAERIKVADAGPIVTASADLTLDEALQLGARLRQMKQQSRP